MSPPETIDNSSKKFDAVHSENLSDNGFKANDLSYITSNQGVEFYHKNYTPPNFTIKELRESIPAHLFKRSTLKSSIHTLIDLLICSILFYIATYFDTFSFAIQLVAWPLYWFFQGVFMTGLWVIAHECGHQAFSDHKAINDFVGFVLHTGLLVPYHSWRISHARHHAHTGHLHEDQVFVPIRRSEHNKLYDTINESVETAPIYSILRVVRILLFGWPAYLIWNASGQPYKQYTSHFHPTSPIFRPHQAFKVLYSDAGLIVAFSVLAYFIKTTSFWTVAKYYLIPYINVNAWLVTITFLQHTDVYIPHYDPKEWNFVRGALTTVDRDFGWFLNIALHHINDSHVAHHLFSQMPFYNAIEATKYLKAKLGQYYLYDRTPLHLSLYRSARNCLFIEDEGDVLFYKSK
ncbi:delta-12 fatty acid desaturase [Neoconidiobolus thromboides FSU 785]|nr:delta-12 fatty acid desaturase [Neoconidiobolus thromboides FSU 785]